MASSRPTIVDEGDKTTRRVSWNVVLLSVVCVLFVLLYACTYFSLRCQLQQLRDDVDQLKVIHSMSLKPAAAAAGHGDDSSRVELRRSKRHDAVNAVNETNDHHNDTSNNDDKQGDGSGEITDHQYPGIWMGTYSRVPMSAVREYCLAMSERCPPSLPGDPGSPGERGPTGEPGVLGPPGLPGMKGDRGDVGLNGEIGMKGERGEKGQKGDIGQPGVEGLPGNDGVNGTEGLKGRRGKRGRAGEPGTKGDKGDEGAAGPPGELLHADTAQLIRGPRGRPGPPGLPGPKGNQGEAGDSCGCVITESTTRLTTTVEPTVEPRVRDCRIELIGKPLFHKSSPTYWGMWLKDSSPHQLLGQKFWLTKHFTGQTLYFYDSLENVKRGEPDGVYELQEPYCGTDNVVYNGSFYYHRFGFNEIIKYDLVRNESVAKIAIPSAAFQGRHYLYSTDYNYFDLAVDENGLWVIYSAEEERDFLLVSKLDADRLTIQKTWNISVRHREYGNAIIACGLLYLIRDVKSTSTTIDYAFDLYTKQRLDVSLAFNNPYRLNTMIAYNHAETQIYSWDRGHLLTYPLLLT